MHYEHLGAEVSITSLLDLHHLLITTLRSPRVGSTSDLCIIIAATLESIWLSHWFFILNDTPFTTDIVLALVGQKIRQHKQESFLAAGLSHSLPFSSLLNLFKAELISPPPLSFCFYCNILTTQPPIQINQQIKLQQKQETKKFTQYKNQKKICVISKSQKTRLLPLFHFS
ncbi:unnamed protein product [Mucor circinelloides]